MRISDWSSDVCSSDLFVEILQDGQGLGEHDAAVDQRRHQALGIERQEAVAALLTLAQLHRHLRVGEPLQVQRDVSAIMAQTGWQGSEERRGGQECGRTCRSRWWPYH